MGTIEKLFVQIFERKKWIEDQVKRQTLLFNQQLASKCLLDGIVPPPWLVSSPANEWNKEELISGLLNPCAPLVVPFPGNHYSIYNKPPAPADKGDLPDSCFTEVHTLSIGFDAGDRLSVSPQLPVNDVRGASNGTQKGDSSAALSPSIQRVKRSCDISPDPAQSLENFQGSKSRKRDLALSNSAKLISNLRDENNAGVLAGGFTGSGIATLQQDHVPELELVEYVDIGKESCKEEAAKLDESQGKGNESCVKELILPQILGLQPATSHSSRECVPYYKSAVISETEELPDASKKELVAEEGLSNLHQFTVNDAGFVSDGVLQMDFNAESPRDQRSSGTSDIDPELLQSLARVQRSKSRQRALKIRRSAKVDKSCLSLENDICVNSSLVTGSVITSLQSDQIHKSELIKTADFDKESSEAVGEYQSKEKSSNIYYGRSTSSQRYVQRPWSMRESSNVGTSYYGGRSSGFLNNDDYPESRKQQVEGSASVGRGFDYAMGGSLPQLKQRMVGGRPSVAESASPSLREDDIVQLDEKRSSIEKMDHVHQLMTEGSKSSPVGISPVQPDQIHESELVKTADFDNESCQVEGAKVYDFWSKEKSSNIYSGRITRSRSSARQPSSVMRESLPAGNVDYAGRSSRAGNNVGFPESSKQKIEENSTSLERGFSSGLVGSSPQFKIMDGDRLTDFVSASPCLRDDDVVRLNEDKSPVDKMDHVEQLVKNKCKSSPIGISSLDSDQILESEPVKTADFDNESCHVGGANMYDFQSKEKSGNINSGSITRYQSSVLQTNSVKESSHARSLPYAERSDRTENSAACPESSEQLIEENSACLGRDFGSVIVGPSPHLKQREVGCRLTDAVSAAPSLREDDVVQSNEDKSPVDKIDNVEQLLIEGSKSSSVGVSSLQPEPIYELILSKPADAYCGTYVVKEANIGDIQSKENGSNSGSDRTKRSQTPSQQHGSTRDSLNAGRSSREDKIVGSSELRQKNGMKSILPGNNFNCGAEDSWPQHKRRKVDGYLNDHLSASPSLRGEVVAQSGVNKSPAFKMDQNGGCKLKWESQSSNKLQVDKDKPRSEEDRSAKNTPFTFIQESEVPSVPSCINQASGDPKACSDAEAAVLTASRAIVDLDKQSAMGGDRVLLHLDNKCEPGNTEHLSFAESGMHEEKSHLERNDKSSKRSFGSPQRQIVELIGADQVMPEFEGFIMETDNGHSCTVGEGINFDVLDLPKTTIERASVLEQLCKSACMHTPLSHFSTIQKLHQAPNLYHSVPSGLLEGIDLGTNPSINDNFVKQLKASYSYFDEEACHAIQGRSYSDCLPFSSAQPASDIRKPFGSPNGKFWDRITSNSFSSEKRGSSNPELPCISEENENMDEVADAFPELISSEIASPVGELWASNSSSLEKRGSLNLELPFISEEVENTDMVAGVHQGIRSQVPSLVKREPLADIINPNLPADASEADIFSARSSLESVKTEFCFPGTCNKAMQKHGHHSSNQKKRTRQAKMSHSTSLGENVINRAGHNRFSRPKLSGKPSLRKGDPSFVDRETKHNNIVSNVTSFIPLVQQKKAAAMITGKRDVRVKALEAAEAAKRLAEEKENERKMKKEALKLERARLEQENLKQFELQKKKKEEDRKKKEADIAARKRQREEEERTEKGQKRKRVVEARKQQQENEEKIRAKKEEERKKKETVMQMDGQLNLTKASKDETWRDDKRVKEQGGENLGKMLKIESKATVISTSDVGETTIVLDCGDKSEATSHLEKATAENLVTNQNQEPSYDISPYKDSDDEEEEDDDRPNTKFIPSWASKRASNLVISSLLSVNPEVIFLPGSFCSISEVLLPRRQQLNRKL